MLVEVDVQLERHGKLDMGAFTNLRLVDTSIPSFFVGENYWIEVIHQPLARFALHIRIIHQLSRGWE